MTKRIILELGAGTALHGGQYTKAAVRAVDDALHHSSLSFLRALEIVVDDDNKDVTVIASAAIAVRVDLPGSAG